MDGPQRQQWVDIRHHQYSYVNAPAFFLRDIHEYYDGSKKSEEYPAKNKIGCYFINNFLQSKWEKNFIFLLCW